MVGADRGGPAFRRLLLHIDVNANALGKISQARREMDQLGGSAARAGAMGGQMGGAFAAGSIAVAVGLGAALRTTAEFRTQATLAAFAAGGAAGNINAMAQSAKNLSSALGQSPVAMASLGRSPRRPPSKYSGRRCWPPWLTLPRKPPAKQPFGTSRAFPI